MAREVELRDDATVAEAMRAIDLEDDDEVGVYLNGDETYWKHPLKDGDVLQFVRPIRGAAPLPPGRRPHAVQLLRNFSSGAQELIILDPYATHVGRQSASSYVGEFVDSMNLDGGTIRMVRLIDSSRWHDPGVLQRIVTACAGHRCSVQHKHTTRVHDRFWIRDRGRVLALGTSFNSMGGKLAFALEMPDSDRDFLLDFLRRNQLI